VTGGLTWVVGRGGLLGSSVERALGPDTWRASKGLTWNQPEQLQRSLREAVWEFACAVAARPGAPWTVCWCAGAGVVGTSQAQLQAETAVLRSFLQQLASHTALMQAPGYVFLASSAGGVYAGSSGRPIDEGTAPRPISDYGRAKLEQEELLGAWARERPGVATLVGRFANLYGPAQRLDKPQGLISHLSRCTLFRVPVHIYVPLDTIRDYLYADDAGDKVAAGLRRLSTRAPSEARQVVKVYGSEREISIAGLIGIFLRLARHHVRVILGSTAGRSQQPSQLQFRSRVWPGESPRPRIDLLEGISKVHQHNLTLFQAGRLPPPAPLARAGAK
jgi:UDP-glucose 4-epimerase